MPRPTEGPKLKPRPERNGTYYIYWTDPITGKSRERSTGVSDSVRAHQIFADWLAHQGPTPWNGPRRSSDTGIADVLAFYAQEHATNLASRANTGYIIKTLLTWWGEASCDAVKPETCRAYVRDRLATVKAATVARELVVLRAALGHAHKNGRLIDRPFVELPSQGPGRDRWLTRSEAAALLWQSRLDPKARDHLPLFILLALATGARPSALFELRWNQIDFDKDRINLNPIGRTQTAKRRPLIPMPRRLRWFLLRAHQSAASPYVLSYQGRNLKGVRRAFRMARLRAGLGPDVIPYTLRHTAGTWLAQAGVDLRQIGGWLGHSQERTTELYAHHHPDYFRAARKVMD